MIQEGCGVACWAGRRFLYGGITCCSWFMRFRPEFLDVTRDPCVPSWSWRLERPGTIVAKTQGENVSCSFLFYYSGTWKSHRATPTLKSISKSSPSPFKKLPMWGVCSTRPVVESSTILSNIHGLVPSCWQRPSRHSMRQLWWGDLYPAIDGFSSHPLSNDGKPKIDNLEDTPCLFTRVRVFSIGDLNHWY